VAGWGLSPLAPILAPRGSPPGGRTTSHRAAAGRRLAGGEPLAAILPPQPGDAALTVTELLENGRDSNDRSLIRLCLRWN
jgi:hypothetical protein